MPDDDGRLTEVQKQTIINWLTESDRAKGPGCPWCGKKNFTIGDHLVAAPLLTIGGNLQLGRQYPLAVVFCDNCAQTILFAAMRIDGLYPKAKAEEAKVSDG